MPQRRRKEGKENMIKVGIIGSTGYAGQELVRILLGHKDAEIVWYGSKSYIDKRYANVYRNMFELVDAACMDDNMEELSKRADVIFTATPQGFLASAVSEDILGLSCRSLHQIVHCTHHNYPVCPLVNPEVHVHIIAALHEPGLRTDISLQYPDKPLAGIIVIIHRLQLFIIRPFRKRRIRGNQDSPVHRNQMRGKA